MATTVAPARSALPTGPAAACGSNSGASSAAPAAAAAPSPLCSVVSSNMRVPLLRAAIAAVSGALKDPSGTPLREVARRIKAELEALPASLCALASARGADADLARQRRPAALAAGAGLDGAAIDGEGAHQAEEEQRQEEQQGEEDGGRRKGVSPSAAEAAPAPPPPPSFPSAHGAQCGGAAWQVALGTCFGAAVSFETRGFAHLRVGSTHVVVWRSRDALPKKPPPAVATV